MGAGKVAGQCQCIGNSRLLVSRIEKETVWQFRKAAFEKRLLFQKHRPVPQRQFVQRFISRARRKAGRIVGRWQLGIRLMQGCCIVHRREGRHLQQPRLQVCICDIGQEFRFPATFNRPPEIPVQFRRQAFNPWPGDGPSLFTDIRIAVMCDGGLRRRQRGLVMLGDQFTPAKIEIGPVG
ncbi:MAG TPA: hypothetical protein VII48_10655, partial [Rhizomicrobium sp.]